MVGGEGYWIVSEYHVLGVARSGEDSQSLKDGYLRNAIGWKARFLERDFYRNFMFLG